MTNHADNRCCFCGIEDDHECITCPDFDATAAPLPAQVGGLAAAREDILHIAVCQAVASLNQGDEPLRAHALLRQALVDYADTPASDVGTKLVAPCAVYMPTEYLSCSGCEAIRHLDSTKHRRFMLTGTEISETDIFDLQDLYRIGFFDGEPEVTVDDVLSLMVSGAKTFGGGATPLGMISRVPDDTERTTTTT